MPFEGSLTSPAPQPSPPPPLLLLIRLILLLILPIPHQAAQKKKEKAAGPRRGPRNSTRGRRNRGRRARFLPRRGAPSGPHPHRGRHPELIRSSRLATAIRQPRTQLATNLSPLYKLDDIYQDITSKALVLGLGAVLKHLGGRALRVATMCSGTESPLLAMELVQQNLRKHFDTTFNFRHLFSAEIVPFKQAYIERNFHPKVMFRDVTELRDRVAQTVYGSLEKIPKNADLLIAGFACVDFSNLNNNRKTLDQNGESGTRERGYLFCVDRELMKKGNFSEGHMLRWSAVFEGFQRPASSPAGMFLIDADDRRLGQIEQDVIGKTSCNPREWSRYQIRHQSYRNDQKLGDERPVSKSKDQGICQMPDFYWHGWARSLPERVWETLDINYLRKLAELEGYDMNYKE
ncbi:hypothetical protein P168DRAFT_306515 [Aspergillus campestris IBT 28561]|uniref:S-adenosyl-L-methionine-dependent methyltransferase n=1 Tax=Aspergillus campestris (strain IBT 28561) TaxID=1392248 RepID=A0A2I1CUP2_ASPC2|nr:uncharacterized protein P168DRAFT_306515 [Aspergillus campestris IBT 28561]PKY01331.1 hypothetical protein P168DRAFT_306515 [Aspergillus campestris IBT 28561]